ncbi:MAG: heme o synthase [Anaerolineales bacterium]
MTRSALPLTPTIAWFRWLALAAAGAVLAMVMLNSQLRIDGSAACLGYWPLCNGQWLTPLARFNWIDIAFRAAAAIAVPLVVALAVAAWRAYRRVRWVLWPATLAFALLLIQFLLGSLTPQPALAVLHAALNLTLLALLTVVTVVAFQLWKNPHIGDSLIHFDAVSRTTGAALLATFGLTVLGAAVAAFGARTACPDWPLCNGADLPDSALGWLSMAHRFTALIAGVLLAGGVWRAWQLRREHTPVVVAGTLTGSFFFGQVLISAANVHYNFPLWLNGLHSATAMAVWVSVVVFAVLAFQYVRVLPLAARIPAWSFDPAQLRAAVADYIILTKPIIMVLLLITTAAAMVLAGHDWPPLDLFVFTMLGGGLASGGASALNQVIDRDLDKHMARTSRRPIAQGRVSSAEGLAFGLALTVLAYYVLAAFVNQAAAFWAMVGSAYYVLGYSILLKKNTPQNIVIGGGAGAIPPLVGWAAVSGGVGLPALFLFALIFFWTPPHFWALSLLKKNDYARAGVPMLPVVVGDEETRRQIVWYTLVLVALTLLFTPARVAGTVYLFGAALLGLGFVAHALWLYRAPSNKVAWRLYKYSSYYLALIFAVLVVDRFFFM